MFGIRITSEKYVSDLERQVKGFYEGEDNARNEYIRALAKVARGMELAPFGPVGRGRIREIYCTSAPVMGVVNYIAENVGEVSRWLELRDLKTGDYVERHWLIDLLNRPNDRFTRRKFFTAWAINKLLYGDAWTYAMSTVGKDRHISQMYIIPSHRISVNRGGEAKLIKGIMLPGLGGVEIEMKDVFESFDYNLDDTSAFGTSKIVAAAIYLSVMDRGMGREDAALGNGGVANIITPQPDKTVGVARPSEADSLEQEINGKDMANKTKVLRYPIEVHQLGNAPVDLNILESHKEAVTALCFVYRLPVDLYYGQAKYENAKEAKKTIYEQNAIPMANEFAEDLINFCGLAGQYELSVNTDKVPVLQDKATDTLDVLDKMCATLNEKREAAGYDRIEEEYADKPMIPMGIQFGEGYEYDIPGEV